MPRILGVIAEYNPFHLGHAHHLQLAREAAGADYVVVVMSSCFTQRGDAALLSPSDRARMALACGADAVFALPAAWAVRDAEHFALGGIHLLDALGCTHISFGSECADQDLLMRTAALVESPGAAFTQHLRSRLSAGVPYPAALAEAAEEALPGAGQLLSSPNSTLAICYLRALLRLHSGMTPVIIPRTSSYHETTLGTGFPSATAIRSAVLRGGWQSVKAAMPESAYDILAHAVREGRIHRPAALDAALLYRLRCMSAEEYAALPDLSEGVESRLRAAAASSCTREELLLSAKTRRYPYARLSRMATHALLGVTETFLKETALPDAAWLLGFRKEARPLLAHLKADSRIPLIAKASDHTDAAPWFELEQRAYDLWALGAGLPAGLAMQQGVAVVD